MHVSRQHTRLPKLPNLSKPSNPRQTYVVKLARSGEEGEKVYLLLESGARFHTTKVGV